MKLSILPDAEHRGIQVKLHSCDIQPRSRVERYLSRVKLLSLMVVIILFTGCQTVSQPKAETESRKDVREALGVITQAISGKQLSKEELKNLTKDLRTDKEARSAIQSITDSMSRKKIKVKYCPVTGRRYAPSMSVCPEHKVKLKWLKE